jgi:small-conductance mechanosensitive channel
MDGQRARLVTRTLDRVPTIRRVSADEARPAPDRLTPTWAGILGFGWPLAIVASIALEPAPADPEAAVPIVVSLASIGLFAALVATAVAAGNRQPSAAIAGVVTGLLALGFTVSCPVSGHHTFGAWWFGQMALTLAMLGVSLAALGRRAREPA